MLTAALGDILKRNRDRQAEAMHNRMEEARKRLAPTTVPRNPDREPPLDPVHHVELKRLGAAVGKEYRWYWMKQNRCFGIQVRESADKWQTVFICYDEETACEGNWTPFKIPDRRDYEAFCRTDLGIRYGTGDIDKDRALRDRDVDARMEEDKQRRHQESLEAIFMAMTGGDPRRHEKFLDHASQHTPDGCGFKEFYSVGVDLKAKP
jgi:hypothetical protein